MNDKRSVTCVVQIQTRSGQETVWFADIILSTLLRCTSLHVITRHIYGATQTQRENLFPDKESGSLILKLHRYWTMSARQPERSLTLFPILLSVFRFGCLCVWLSVLSLWQSACLPVFSTRLPVSCLFAFFNDVCVSFGLLSCLPTCMTICSLVCCLSVCLSHVYVCLLFIHLSGYSASLLHVLFRFITTVKKISHLTRFLFTDRM